MNYIVNIQTKVVIDITGIEKDISQVKKLLDEKNIQIGNFTLNAMLQGNVDEAAGFTIMDSEDLADSGILNGSEPVGDFVVKALENSTTDVNKIVEEFGTSNTGIDKTLVDELGKEGAEEIIKEVKNEEVCTKQKAEKAIKDVMGISLSGGLGKLGDSTVNEEKRVYTKKEQTAMNARNGNHSVMVESLEAAGTYLNYVATDKDGAERWLEFNITGKNSEEKPDSRKNPNLFVSPTKKGYNITLYLEGRSSGNRLKVITETTPDLKTVIADWMKELEEAGNL